MFLVLILQCGVLLVTSVFVCVYLGLFVCNTVGHILVFIVGNCWRLAFRYVCVYVVGLRLRPEVEWNRFICNELWALFGNSLMSLRISVCTLCVV